MNPTGNESGGSCTLHGLFDGIVCPGCNSAQMTYTTNHAFGSQFPKPVVAYEAELKQLVDAMRYKLKKNAHKGKWEGMTLDKAIELLKGEVAELEEAASRDSDIEIILEAADVANFALIVANLAMKRGANV